MKKIKSALALEITKNLDCGPIKQTATNARRMVGHYMQQQRNARVDDAQLV